MAQADWQGLLASWMQEPGNWLLVLLLIAVFVLWGLLWESRTRAGRRVRRHYRQGQEAEHRAEQVLRERGYTVTQVQANGSYRLLVDGQPLTARVRVDFIVEKAGQVFAVEVKSGEESAKVSARATRRQLLEYLYTFDVDAVLLLDMVRRRIVRVDFLEEPRETG